jgi:hypothetical protein
MTRYLSSIFCDTSKTCNSGAELSDNMHTESFN